MTAPHFLQLRNRFLKTSLIIAFLFILVRGVATPINMAAVDIGRHVKNGELICGGQWDVLYKNFYSYTYPEHHFINHHWLFGVISFWVWKFFGFEGTGYLYIGLIAMSFLLFFLSARRMSFFSMAFLLSLIAFPLLVDRKEIRPEGFSVFFIALYFYMLTRWRTLDVPKGVLYVVLVLAQLLWVNIHIFFFVGPLLVIIFWWEEHLHLNTRDFQRTRGQTLAQCEVLRKLLCFTMLINLLNPSGLVGALTPLNIFKEFGYRLAENQNIFFMMGFFPNETIYRTYFIILFVGVLGIVLACVRTGLRKHWPFICLFVIFAVAGIKAVRLMTFFGFVMIALSAYFYQSFIQSLSLKSKNIAIALVGVLGGILLISRLILLPAWKGTALMQGIEISTSFYKQAGLKGPIFSNYDIGGYLIFYLSQHEKVFVDNRQEAFPPSFFKETYIPMQENYDVWRNVDNKYGFNVIYFYRQDLTPWGQNFMIQRVKDSMWAPVYVDDFVIIFLKRTTGNQGLIERYEIPKARFSITAPRDN